MKKERHWLERLADQADLPGENMGVQPIVEILGDRRVLIEQHQGVIQYGSEKICVKVRYGLVAVEGCCLELLRMSRQQLIIRGRIDGISLCRRSR